MGDNRRSQDHFTRKAFKEHYPARSVYKLEEIDKRIKLLKPGMKVLDLGAAPGSWSLYVSKKIGPSGLVVAVDRAPMTIGLPTNVKVLTVNALDISEELLFPLTNNKKFDVIISDMAPKTSGHKFVDQSRSFTLFCRALELAEQLCCKGGCFVGKIFVGEEFEEARTKVKQLFEKNKIIRPKSVRTQSFETYLIGICKKES